MQATVLESDRAIELLDRQIEELLDENPEIGDFREGFRMYCMGKYSLGSSATTISTAGKNDHGITFYSSRERTHHVVHCDVPEQDWLEANAGKVRSFGPTVVQEARGALEFLLDGSGFGNEQLEDLRHMVGADRDQDDFELVFFLIVYGRLNDRAVAAFTQLKHDYEGKSVRVLLQQVHDLADEFLVGSAHDTGEIQLNIRYAGEVGILRAHEYCYFLANAADLLDGFEKYGWRLFDLNLRYEVRNSAINGDILRSLQHQKTRKQFHHYNNGLIVVARRYAIRTQHNSIHLTGPQIVNGLQTVKSIYNAVKADDVTREQLERECLVQIKVINTNDAEFVGKVVQATNNQNPMHARNLKANGREQKILRAGFASLTPRWFLQVKEGEWESLTDEGGRFFKQVVGFNPAEFRAEPQRKKGRVIDNQDAAKAWLALVGFADLAGDRVTHYFSDPEVYQLAFTLRPTERHWELFASKVDFDAGRRQTLRTGQGEAVQLMLAYALFQFIRSFVPSAQRYREEGLHEGVRAGKLQKSSGSVTSPPSVQDQFLADNLTYQTWRLMANMKEVLLEVASHILARRYGNLEAATCTRTLHMPELRDFMVSGDMRGCAAQAGRGDDLPADAILGRIFCLLKYVASQYWEDRRSVLLSTSRIGTVLLRRDVIADSKRRVWEVDARRGLDRVWKPAGVTFLESLPDLH
jgi:hypothetical protein